MEKFKYCSYYGCGRLLPADFEGDTCPHCKHTQYSWDRKEWIKPLPPEAYEVEMKCKDCESTEELQYSEKRTYGSNDQYHYGNNFQCKTCDDKFKAEMKRQEAMNYIVMNPDDDEIDFHIDKDSVEKMFDKFLEDYWSEGENPFDEWVILKVEKIDGFPKKKHFDKRNVIQYEYEWYVVEEIIEPEYEYSGDHSVNW